MVCVNPPYIERIRPVVTHPSFTFARHQTDIQGYSPLSALMRHALGIVPTVTPALAALPSQLPL